MSERRPIINVNVKRGDKTYSLISIWKSEKLPGAYSVSLDKGSDRRPAMNLLEALKAFAARDAFIDVYVASESAQSRSGGNYDRPSRSDMDDPDEIPF